MFYILENKKVVKADLEIFSDFCKDFNNKVVAKTKIGNSEVSTVFLGANFGYPGRFDAFFETMVFGGSQDGEMERYATYEQAEEGHRRMVDRVKASIN